MKQTAPYDATICTESFYEALKNFDKNALLDLRSFDMRSLAPFARSPSISEIGSSKKVTHISAFTFEQNKNGWAALAPTVTVDLPGRNFSLSDNFVGLLSKSILDNTFKYNIQVRGFKTERSVHADLKRNPNLLNRLRKFLGQYGTMNSQV